MVKGLISCIIPVIRNDPHVAGCIESIKKSIYQHYEIIIVDEGLERSAQRNIGIKRAKGEFLIFLDSDMRITPYLLLDCIEKIKGHTAIYIPEKIVTKGFFGYLRNWERQFYNGTLIDVVRFIRADSCPLFDETLHGPEDSDWNRRILKMYPDSKFTVSSCFFEHNDGVGLIQYLKKKAYYAKSLNKYKQRNPEDKLLTFKYRCWDVFVENGKWKNLLIRPDMSFLVTLLIMARGVIFIIQSIKYK